MFFIWNLTFLYRYLKTIISSKIEQSQNRFPPTIKKVLWLNLITDIHSISIHDLCTHSFWSFHFKNHWWSKAMPIISTCWFHSGMQRASYGGASPLTCLSPLCRAALRAGDVLTSWCVLSVLLHSSFRFSSSLSLCLCSRRSVAWDGIPARMFSWDSIRPEPSVSAPGKPVLPEPSGSSSLPSPLLYSAQRFRMVSSRCLSCDKKYTLD